MKYYYGLVDVENLGYGFVDEDDARITDDFIELTEEEWQTLLTEQSEGKQIVCFEGKVFTAEQGKYYVDETGVWQVRTDEEFEELQTAAEKERISNLSLTAADVERAIYKARNIDFDDIVDTIEAMNEAGTADIDIKALKIELKANNFYRGNEYVETIGNLLGFTSDDLDYLFENGELPSTES